jgi:serine/threonine protein kinase
MVGRALLLPGMSCGPYDILQDLGRGLIAETHLAKHRRTGEEVVLTCSDFSHASAGAPAEDAFAARVAKLVSADMEGIARVLRGGKDGAVFWVAAEHVEGPDVRAFSRRRAGRHKVAVMLEAVSFGMIVAEILMRAEAAGLTHGDLAPENIVMRRGIPMPMILGMGYAKLFGLDRRAARSSPLYRAPEQLQGEAWDSRADIYSLGMILVELISGAPPFAQDGVVPEGAELLALAERAMPESVSDPDHCPPYVGQAVRGSIYKDPALRYRSWSELKRALSLTLDALLEEPGMRGVIEADEEMKDASGSLREVFAAESEGSGPPRPSASAKALIEAGPRTVPQSARTRARIAREVARATAAVLAGEAAGANDRGAEESESESESEDGGAARRAHPGRAPREPSRATSSKDQGTPPPRARRDLGATPLGGAAPSPAPPPAPSPPAPSPAPSGHPLTPRNDGKEQVTLSSIEIAGRGGRGASRSERPAAFTSRKVTLLAVASSVIAGALGGLLVFLFGHRLAPSVGALSLVPVAERALDVMEPANPFRLAPVSPVPPAASAKERATKTNVPIGRALARGEASASMKAPPAGSADAVAPGAGKQTVDEKNAPAAAIAPSSTAEPAPPRPLECSTWALCGKDLIEGAR